MLVNVFCCDTEILHLSNNIESLNHVILRETKYRQTVVESMPKLFCEVLYLSQDIVDYKRILKVFVSWKKMLIILGDRNLSSATSFCSK